MKQQINYINVKKLKKYGCPLKSFGKPILSLRLHSNGSIIAGLVLTFSDKDTEGLTDLLAVVRNNSFGDFEVDPDALVVVITGV